MTELSAALARKIAQTIAGEIGAQPAQVVAAVGLLDEGATVPFIARYRKEVTGGLDDTQLRNLEVRLAYLREMEERRATILASIDEQGKLTDELRAEIEAADSKSRLEDLYLPYKQKRRTRAQIAREAGLSRQKAGYARSLAGLVAATGRALKINSDARYRFERGIDPAFTLPGLDLATQMILDLCGGTPSEIMVAGRSRWTPRPRPGARWRSRGPSPGGPISTGATPTASARCWPGCRQTMPVSMQRTVRAMT